MNATSYSIRIKLILIIIFSLCTMAAFAAPPSFNDDEQFGVDDEGNTAPIDGFIGIAMAAGVAYGFKVLKKKPI